MTRWHYELVKVRLDKPEETTELMEEYGEESWELVTSERLPDADAPRALLMFKKAYGDK